MKGQSLGLLHGIPFAAKDLVNTAGVRTTFGSLLYENNVPKEDAVCAARVKAAGGILFGKTTTPEFGHKSLTDGPLFGRTRNAWSAAHTSGGSSGGAAVAVAAGYRADRHRHRRRRLDPHSRRDQRHGRAESRATASYPTARWPTRFGNYTYVTPMTRTVMDTALMLQAMAGPHPSDPWSIGIEPPDYLDRRPRRRRSQGQAYPLQRDPGQHARGEGRPRCLSSSRWFGCASWAPSWSNSTMSCPTLGAAWKVINHTTWKARFDEMIRRDGNRMTPSLVRQVAEAADWSGADLSARHVPAQRALPHGPALVRDRRLPGHADRLAHRAGDRPGPVRSYHHRRRRGPASCGATGFPTPCRSTSPATPPYRSATATIPKACRRPACRSSAASATRPRCCAPPRSTRRARAGSTDGPTFEAAWGAGAKAAAQAAAAADGQADPGPRAAPRRSDPCDRQAGWPRRPRRAEWRA